MHTMQFAAQRRVDKLSPQQAELSKAVETGIDKAAAVPVQRAESATALFPIRDGDLRCVRAEERAGARSAGQREGYRADLST